MLAPCPRPTLAATALALALPAFAQVNTAAVRDAVLADEISWDITEGLTTEVSPRLAGAEAEARARVLERCAS